MYPSSSFQYVLFLATAQACILFQATAPYDDNQPFLASITDNGIVTCWISMTYAKHIQMQKQTPVVRKQDADGGSGEGGMEWEFLPWEFECLEGFEARAMVGRRGYVYRAHGKGLSWVANIWEDVWGRAYKYQKQLYCPKSAQGWMP